MSTQDLSAPSIIWRISLRATPRSVYKLLSTAKGRERFWAESAPEQDGSIHFVFPNGERLEARILEQVENRRFAIQYFEGTSVEFSIAERTGGGCTVTLQESGQSSEHLSENAPGWVSVLLNLKAVADFQVDLRNHSSDRTWAQGFVDN